MMKVTVLYFAQLKQRRGLSEESLLTDAGTIASLYDSLDEAHSFSMPLKQVKAARNDAFCDPNSPIHDGDTIAFMPPMSGG